MDYGNILQYRFGPTHSNDMHTDKYTELQLEIQAALTAHAPAT